MSLGKLVVSISSTKQNINGKSSTEDDLVSVEDTMAKIFWSKYFIDVQEYNIDHNKLLQDNKIAILLKKW